MSNNLTKVRYFEPNEDEHGKIKNFDGMSIGVALEIEVPSLSLTQESTIYKFHTVKHRESVDFFKQNLGSAYEHIGEPMILEDYNMNEKIGLNNIRIEYNHWMYPTVTMDIIDINGHGLNGMESINTYSNNKQIRKGHSLFESFFTMPYPFFKLTFKGYLGESVTFNLTVETVKIKLNDSVGNFTLNVKFIGSKFGELTDIPMHFLILAPYLLGKKNDIGDLTHGGKMYTFKKLNNLLKKYEISADNFLNGRKGRELAATKNELVHKKSSLQGLLIFIDSLETPLSLTSFVRHKINTRQYGKQGNSGDIMVNNGGWEREKNGDIIRQWIPWYSVGVTPITEYTPGSGNIALTEEYKDKYAYFDIQCWLEMRLYEFNVEVKKILGGDDNIVGMIDDNDCVDFGNKWREKNPSKHWRFIGYYYDNNLKQRLSDEIKKFDDEIQKIDKELGEGLSKLLTNSLGFPFNVGNFMEIICGHLDCFYKVMENTCKEIKNQQSKRVYSGIKNVIVNGKKSGIGNMTIPPFPSITNNEEEVWFDEVGLDYFAERNLVVNTYDIILQWEVARIKEAMNAKWDEKMSYIPNNGFATLYSDIWEDSFYGKRQNPYSRVKNIDDLATVFMNRCILRILSCNSDKYSVDGHIPDELFGQLEALNALKAKANDDSFISNMVTVYEYDFDKSINAKWPGSDILNLFKGYPIFSYNEYANGLKYKESDDNSKPRVLPYDSSFVDFDDAYFSSEIILFNNEVYFEGENIKVIDEFSKDWGNLKNLGINISEYEKIFPVNNKYPWYEGWLKNDGIPSISSGSIGTLHDEINGFFGIYKVTKNKDTIELSLCENFAHIKKGGFGEFVEKIINATTEELSSFTFGSINFYHTDDKTGRFLVYFCELEDNSLFHMTRLLFSKFLGKDYQNALKKNKDEAIVIKFMESLAGNKFLESYGDDPIGYKRVHPLLMAVHGARCYLYRQKYEEEYKKSHGLSTLISLRKALREIIGLKYYQAYSDFATKCIAYWHQKKGWLIKKIKTFKDDGFGTAWILQEEYGKVLQEIFNQEPIEVFAIANKTLRYNRFIPDENDDSLLSEMDYIKLSGYTDSCGEVAIGAFVDTLKTLCTERQNELNNITAQQNERLCDMNKTEIYKYIYITYKQLYDRWKLGTKKLNFDYNSMRIVNQFHEDISQAYMINILDFDIFKDITFEENDVSVITYINQRFSDFGFQSIILPSNIGNHDISKIFEVIPYTSFTLDDRPTYIAYYAQYESEKIYDNEYESNDGIDYTNFTVYEDGNTQIFGVTYGLDKQSIFNKIEVGSDKPKATAHSIKAQFNVAELGNPDASKIGMQFNNNLYPVYTNNSYECRVSMIGCAQMFPTLLFQLNNVPLFKGLYLITNVSHDIKGNVMTTAFSGTKVTWKKPRMIFQSNSNAIYSAPIDDSSGDISGEWRLANESEKQKAAKNEMGISELKQLPQDVTDEYKGGYTLKDTYIIINPGHGYNKKHDAKQSPLFEYGNVSGIFPEYEDDDGNLSDVYQAFDRNTGKSVVDEENYKTRLREYWLNRKMSLALREELIKLGVPEEHIVFEKNDVDSKDATSAGSSNIMESYYSKNKKAIVISMHHNAMGNGSNFNTTKYWCVFAQYPTYIHKEGKYVNVKNPETSFEIAKSLIKEMQGSGITELGNIKSNPQVYTYKKNHPHPLTTVNNCPTIMIEGGFYTNKDMVKWYGKSTNRTRIAQVYAQGIVNFLNNN